MSNIVRAIFGGSKTTRTRRLWKIDRGMLLQFVDLNLPAAYQVHFANSPSSGQAKVVTATSDTVEIPYEYLQTGADVYAWIYLTPENGVGYTEYMVTIPVYARPDTTDEEPVPAQQSALDTAISALNSGVESVQAAVAGVQDSIDAALQEAKDSGEFDGADGYTPVKGVDYFDGEKGDTGATGETGNGIASAVLNADYTLTLTYTDGTTWTSGSIRGERGDKGETGADGYSPAATVTQTETGATISITDAEGTTTANIRNGQDGAPGAPGSPGTDGVSPTISVTDITGGHRVTITDATGAHSFDVMDGESGAGAVQDVQVNGVSVLQDGVANVPMASASVYGVIRTGSVSVSGTTPTINAIPGIRYICGEVTTIDIMTPASGIIDVVFTSGSTPAVLTVTPPSGMTMKWANGFDPTTLEADTTYEINIADGCLGVAGTWS